MAGSCIIALSTSGRRMCGGMRDIIMFMTVGFCSITSIMSVTCWSALLALLVLWAGLGCLQ